MAASTTETPAFTSFRKGDIDNAIVMTLADLGGFFHPLGFRQEKRTQDQKGFCFIPKNLVDCASGHRSDLGPPVFAALYPEGPYEQQLFVCQQFAASCGGYQKFAVQELILIILREDRERKATANERPSRYYLPLSRECWYGKTIIALAEAFEVPIPQEQLDWPAHR